MGKRWLVSGAYLTLSLAAGGVAVLLFQQNHTPPLMSGYDQLCPVGAIQPKLGPTCGSLDGLFVWLTALRSTAAILIAATVLLTALLLIRRQRGRLSVAALPLALTLAGGISLAWLSQQALATYWRLSVTPMSDPTSPEQRVAFIQRVINGYIGWDIGAFVFTLVVLGAGLLLLRNGSNQRPQVIAVAPVM